MKEYLTISLELTLRKNKAQNYPGRRQSISGNFAIIMVCALIFLSLTSKNLTAQPIQKVIAGKIVHLANFPSHYVEPRNIDIWLPENYDGKKKFAVLYLHDGQMLFDSTTTWNHQSWNVDDVMTSLIQSGKIRNTIVVGIWNTGKNRHPEYFPQKPWMHLTGADKDSASNQLKRCLQLNEPFQSIANNYLKFLVREVKPMVDKRFSVSTNRKNTFVGGSSMGGLISIYALCEYPGIFGGAACLSTHWIGSFVFEYNPLPGAFHDYLKEKLPRPGHHLIYFDCGDQGLDASYPPYQKEIDILLQQKGYTSRNSTTRYFPGKSHSENAWQERLDQPLLFLLGK